MIPENQKNEYDKYIEEFEKVKDVESLRVIGDDAESHGFKEIKDRVDQIIANIESTKASATEVPEYQRKEIENQGGSLEAIEERLAEIIAEADQIVDEGKRKIKFLVEPEEGKFLVDSNHEVKIGGKRRFLVEDKSEKEIQLELKEKDLEYFKREISSMEDILKSREDLLNQEIEVVPIIGGYPNRAFLKIKNEQTDRYERLWNSMKASPFVSGGKEHLEKELKNKGFSLEVIARQVELQKELDSIREDFIRRYSHSNVYWKGSTEIPGKETSFPVIKIGNDTHFDLGNFAEKVKNKTMLLRNFAEIGLKSWMQKKEEAEKEIKSLKG